MNENGDINAQFCIDEMYKNGYGIEQSYSEAMKWHVRSVDRYYNIARLNVENFIKWIRGWTDYRKVKVKEKNDSSSIVRKKLRCYEIC
jgi:hypothetical protein